EPAPIEAFDPVVEWQWPESDPEAPLPDSDESLSTPIVVQLTDDDGDGAVTDRDVPDVVFVTWDIDDKLAPQVLRAVSGDSGETIFATEPHETDERRYIFSLGGLAAADLDGDGEVEIVVPALAEPKVFYLDPESRLLAFDSKGRRIWTSQTYRSHPAADDVTFRDNPSVADLDGDGQAEIVVGATVFDAQGQRLWAGSGGQGYQSVSNADDPRSGAISIVADLDLDGSPEVVAGNTAYRADGTVYWTSPLDDGFTAVANFDADPFPEIVVVAHGTVRLHEHNGLLAWGPVALPGSDPEAGGAPTVADFDGDGAPEIGVAGSDFYTVFETDGTPRWQRSTSDRSSNTTGSTVFDFDGDGRFEVVYRDETHLRVYRGSDGVVLYETAVSSSTETEGPVVVDLDRDGSAEILITSDLGTAAGASPVEATRGLRVYGDAQGRWIGARSIWNQNAFHLDNIADDGTVPTSELRGWQTHNTYRANASPLDDPFAAADATASWLRLDVASYPMAVATARIGNGGDAPLAAGLPVAFYLGDPDSGGTLLGVGQTSIPLAAGQFEDVSVTFELPGFGAVPLTAVAGDDGSGTSDGRRDCEPANDRHSHVLDTGALGLVAGIDDGRTTVNAGDVVTYEVRAANASAFTRTGVTVTATLPSHVEVVSVGDGGTASGSSVTWPTFDLPGGTVAARTLTLRVAPDIPLTITQLAVTATVDDDGSQGPDPTPSNNQATDIDQVLTVRADAGGPYAGDEGAAILFDGSASSDRDGAIVEYAWDLDGAGDFDDGSGVTPSFTYSDDGVVTIGLRVTDDSGQQSTATAEVTVANVAPTASAGGAITGTEGDALVLVGATYADPGSGDTHTGTVDWGDGTVDAGPVDPATGAVDAGHVYA
ncbi:MAG: FG-GAP-like repeat-containing protein, partial [Acidobacteriota bacterium]